MIWQQIRVNPPDLFSRFERYPKQLDAEVDKTLEQSLLHIQGSVPAYPRQRSGSSYKRTETLGRSLGSGFGGGQGGNPDIRQIKKLGSGKYEARFGTRLHYAPKVIGTHTQKPLFKSLGWWTMRDVKNKAEPGIKKLFDAMAKRLAKFLGGR